MIDYDGHEWNKLENLFHSKAVRLSKACETIHSITGIPATEVRHWIFKKMGVDNNENNRSEK